MATLALTTVASSPDAAFGAGTGTTASDREVLEELDEVQWAREKRIKVDSEREDMHCRAISIERRLGRLLGFEPRTSAATERRSATEL